jgi:hypothetical protein
MTADAVAVLPEDDVPEGAVEVARAYLEQLGAAPLLERLEPLRASASTDT